MRSVALAIGLAAPLAIVSAPAAATEAQAALAYPVPPCAGTPSPAYPGVGAPPIIQVWRDTEARSWRPADCTGFAPIDANSVVATAGRFRLAGGIGALAERVARISALATIRYFSVREEQWEDLLNAAFALHDAPAGVPPKQARRADFTPDDVAAGRTLRYWQEENSLLSPVVYRLTVRERTPDRLVYTIVNESPMKAMFVRVSEPGEFRQLYIIERDASVASGDVWRYYSLVHGRTKTGPFTLSSRSYINRAAAYYRHMAGIPTDLEPPAAQ